MFDPSSLEKIGKVMEALDKYMPLVEEILERVPFEVKTLTIKDKEYIALCIERKPKP